MVRRQTNSNAIDVENSDTGKTATRSPRAEESIQIVNENFENLTDRNSDIVFDGPLNSESIYSGFIEVIGMFFQGDSKHELRKIPEKFIIFFCLFPVNKDDKDVMSTFSGYIDPLHKKTTSVQHQDEKLGEILSILTYVLCVLILLVLVLLTTLCVMHRVNTTKRQGNDVISLRDSLSRAFCGGRNNQSRRHLLGPTNQKPTDIGPIHRDDLLQAYIQRHKDTDYGFLREFEMLPNRFGDRTTKHSDTKENTCKNRYPDIKAYDQTRVKLSERTTNGSISAPGSDYINANFVIGYKERKKFICAQGPMDSTVNDFWRMIWEQHLEIIVMLTNLEEYNKAKCAKYWPEQINDTHKFGEITVEFTHVQRYTDYLVRELKITRTHSAHNNKTNSNGNGGGGGGGGGLSNGSVSGDEEEERHITQYHYLAWKDFMAPELGVIRFIRQINDVYSVQRGPILVHCSG